MRPRQWVKNVLVLAAPLAAAGRGHRYDYASCGIQVPVAFVVFSLAASAIYLINDVRDVEADREHPTKRFRPDRGRRGARMAGLRPGRGARGGVAGPCLVADAEPGAW